MKKVLFVATYPTQSTGYSRVAHKISNFLAKSYEVHYFGYHNYKDSFVERSVDSSINFIDVIAVEKERGDTLLYGDNLICEYIDKIKPDILIIYNDILVVTRMFNALNNGSLKLDRKCFKTVVYIDLVYEYERNDCIKFMDANTDIILTFSDFWRDHLIKLGLNENKLKVMYHGFESTPIHENLTECREHFKFDKDDFVILNCNRNTYRKALDITIKGFILFLMKCGMDKHIKLFLTCDLDTNSGYIIIDIIRNTCIEVGANYEQIVTNHILTPSNRPLTDTDMLKLYKATDVGVNSAIGEGFGLCNLEHSYAGKVQVLSRVGAINDIFSKDTALLVEPVASYHISCHTDKHNGLVRLCLAEDFAEKFEYCYNNREEVSAIGEKCKKVIDVKFNWDNILDRLGSLLKSLLVGLETSNNSRVRKVVEL